MRPVRLTPASWVAQATLSTGEGLTVIYWDISILGPDCQNLIPGLQTAGPKSSILSACSI